MKISEGETDEYSVSHKNVLHTSRSEIITNKQVNLPTQQSFNHFPINYSIVTSIKELIRNQVNVSTKG